MSIFDARMTCVFFYAIGRNHEGDDEIYAYMGAKPQLSQTAFYRLDLMIGGGKRMNL